MPLHCPAPHAQLMRGWTTSLNTSHVSPHAQIAYAGLDTRGLGLLAPLLALL